MKGLEWMKRNKIVLSDSKTDIKKGITELFLKKDKFNTNDSKIYGLAARLKLGNGKRIHRKELDFDNRTGYRFIGKGRMGTIIRSKDFSRLRKLKDEWEGLCSGCREQTPDTIEHQILECKGFEDIRERYL